MKNFESKLKANIGEKVWFIIPIFKLDNLTVIFSKENLHEGIITNIHVASDSSTTLSVKCLDEVNCGIFCGVQELFFKSIDEAIGALNSISVLKENDWYTQYMSITKDFQLYEYAIKFNYDKGTVFNIPYSNDSITVSDVIADIKKEGSNISYQGISQNDTFRGKSVSKSVIPDNNTFEIVKL